MSDLGTLQNPLTDLTADMAQSHWENGGGGKVYLDMASHLTTGAGSVFQMKDFADQFQAQLGNNPPVGTVFSFETNKEIRQ